MKTIAAMLCLIAATGGISSYSTYCWMSRHPSGMMMSPSDMHRSHAWLHSQLQLTPAQEAQLAPAEERFAAADAATRARLAAANRALAQVLGKNTSYTPEVAAAVDEVHHAQSEVQKAALEHYFELLAVLNPGQAAKLRQLVNDTLAPAPPP
jgi:Spy/CpxP family protein refolding chaperone